MRIVKKCVKWFLVLGLVGILGLGAGLFHLARTRQPHLDGTVTHASLDKPVRVVRDDWGTPHIFADNEADASFALGYVMAQDRLFQMEVFRRLSQGKLAEIAGPLAVPVDAIIRSFRLRQHAEEFLADEAGQYPEVRRVADAFVAGINHCLDTEPLPFEFTVLGIRPRPFTPVDSLTVAAIMPITFADGLRGDAIFSLLEEKHPNLDIASLFPGYSREAPVTVMESLDEATAYAAAHWSTPPAPAVPGAAAESVAVLNTLVSHLQTVSDLLGPQLGSNSWVLGPTRTKSGKPILANDPHIGFTNPSVWYEAHIRYGEHDLYGHYLALIPYPLLGHNRNYAWALTMFANDDVDLYRETFHPDDPGKVMYKGEWVDVKTETETIRVRFGKDRQCAVRSTPHGPVITDLLRLLEGYEGADVALSWVWQHVPYTDIAGFYRMAHAQDCDDFAAGVALITSPGLNISYADREGNIAWWAAGKVPIRPKHVNSKRLLDGASGQDEILGYIPFDQNPQLRNPERGYIVTANNLSTVKPVGPIDLLEGYWQPGDRAGRIEQLLDVNNAWTLDTLRAVQFDDTAYAASGIVPVVLDAVTRARESLSPREQQALDAFARWDYRHSIDSVGASIYQVFCDALMRQALLDEMGDKCFRGYCTLADHWNFFKYFIKTPESPFWDNLATPVRETRDDIIVGSFRETAAVLGKRCGDDVSRWTWGSIHTMEFKHPFGYLPLLGRIFNVGPFPASGGAQVINNMLYMSGGYDFDVLGGPSTRRLIDFADPEHSLTVLPTGNSGNFMSSHYSDQAPLFMKGEYREPRLTTEQIAAHQQHELNFSPN
jgi:penicillin amidase